MKENRRAEGFWMRVLKGAVPQILLFDAVWLIVSYLLGSLDYIEFLILLIVPTVIFFLSSYFKEKKR